MLTTDRVRNESDVQTSAMNSPLEPMEGIAEAIGSPEPEGRREDGRGEDGQWMEVLTEENRVLGMIAGQDSLAAILDAVCHLVERVSRTSLCSISLLDPGGRHLLRGAAPTLPRGFIDAIAGRAIETGWGPCGIAAQQKEPVVIADLETGAPCAEYRDLALAHGLRSCWSTPITSSKGRVLGTLAVYSRQPCGPTAQHRKLIAQTTHLAAVAIERRHTEAALQRAAQGWGRSEAYLAEAQRLSHTGSFGWNLASGELTWSAETYRLLGYDPAVKPAVELVLRRVHPQDLGPVRQAIAAASRDQTDLDFEHRLLMPGGAVKHVHVKARAARHESGAVEFVGAVMDVTERKRAETLVAGEKRMLEMIAKGGALRPVLDAICRLGEEVSGEVLVSILLLSADGKSLRHGAAPGLARSYTEAIDGGRIGPRAGSCGTAAHRREPVIVSDIASDPLWERYRDLATAHGLRACWSTPIFSSTHEVMGTFALYSREPGEPSPDQRNVIEQMTHLAAVAIERERGEEALRRSEARFQGILEIAEDAIISVDANQRIVLFNQGAAKVFGYAPEEVIGTSLAGLLPQRYASAHRERLERFARAPEAARVMGQRGEVFGLRKNGQEFPAEASISKLDLGGEFLFTVILRDITERKRAGEALRASEQLARGQAEALGRTLDALAQESAPDRLVEHVLRTITRQLAAHSSSVWLRAEGTDRVGLAFAFEGGKLLTGADPSLAKVSPVLCIEEAWPWREVFRSGKPRVLEDIREERPFPWRDHVLSLGVITILTVPLLVAGQVEGVIGIRFTRKRSFRAEELELAQAFAHQAMLAIQLGRLSRQSRQAAVAAERNRMARDIHDTLAQGFTGVILQLEAAQEALSQHLAATAREHMTRAGELARDSLREARRSVRALRPQTLEERDLREALTGLFDKMTAGTRVRAQFTVLGEPRELPLGWEENLLRIGQEVLTNVLRHARASRFNVELVFGRRETRLNLRDNGTGFDPEARHDGFGLRGMRERAEMMGGRLTIQSAKGQGTTVSVVLPLAVSPESSTL